MSGCEGVLCSVDGLFPSGPCARDFCHCSHGSPHPKACLPGLVFHATIGVCDWPWNIPEC